jgi:hypothetical protein
MTTISASITRLLLCRRSVIALVAIGACVVVGLVLKQDTSGAIAAIAIGIAGANAAQGAMESKVKHGE